MPTWLRALTLWEPWASLIASGAKKVETRSWFDLTLVDKRLAIHAAAKRMDDEERKLAETHGLDPEKTPYGCVVAVAEVGRMSRVVESNGVVACWDPVREETHVIENDGLGDYAVGRWMWCLRNVRRLETPIRLRGRQGVWRCGDQVEKAIMREFR